jgi:hypothetical protein
LEEADDLVFCRPVGAQEPVAVKMHVAANERACRLGDLAGVCELTLLLCV